MKMLQIAGGGHKTLKRGDLIPDAPENKIKTACKELLKELAPDDTLYLPTQVTILGDVVTETDREGNHTYSADVEVTYRPYQVETNRVFRETKQKFHVACEDTSDEWGLETTSLTEHKVLKRIKK
ncbi:MAG: hypothetical protein DRI65_10210 [Chloroflexota bacterium]|nr:MAG: hypothetical protein DRI65_10210 [Chloroflexota bacterium]